MLAAARVIGQIDSLSQTHPWFTLIQGQDEHRETKSTFSPKALFAGVPAPVPLPVVNNLGDYVSEARNNELGSLPRELHPSWLAAVNDYGSRDLPAALLHELWKIVTRGDETGLTSLVNHEEPTQKLHIDDINNQPHTQTIATIQHRGSTLTFSHLSAGGGPGMSAYQYALYRIAWDFRADKEDLNTEDPPRHPDAYQIGWWGFSIKPAGLSSIKPARLRLTIHWPVMYWPALLDWELMFSAWRHTLNQMRARIYSEREEMLDYSVDHLGFSYLSNALTVFRHRSVLHENPSRELTSQEWTDLWRELVAEAMLPEAVGSRASEFKQWIEEARVMAAPESGLSTTAAEGILNALGELDVRTRKELQELRRTYLFGQETSPQRREERVLTAIDNHWKEHPWVVRVEEPRTDDDIPF
jgi:hypothetical protein